MPLTLELNSSPTGAANTQAITEQSEQNNEVSSNTTQTYSSPSLSQIQVSKDITDRIKMHSFISGDKSRTTKDMNDINLLLTIENNKQNILNLELANKIKEYKLDINSNYYRKIENKVQSLLEVNNNSDIFIEYFSNTANNFNSLSHNLVDAIEEKTFLVKSNTFEAILASHVISSSQNSIYFNAITKNLLRNIAGSNNEKIVFPNTSIVSSDIPASEGCQFVDKSYFKKHNLIDIQESNEYEYAKEIKTTTSDIVIQNIVNLARNLYFLSPGSISGNYSSNTFRSINYDKKSFIVNKHEVDNFNVFKNILLSQDKIDVNAYLKSNTTLVEKQESNLVEINQYQSIDSITSDTMSGIQNLPDFLTSYIDEVMVEDFRNTNFIRQPLGFTIDPALAIINLCNKVYTGDFFNINLSEFGTTFRDTGISDINRYISLTHLPQARIRYKEQFKENYIEKKEKELIYKDRKTITKLTEGQLYAENLIYASNTLNIDDFSLVSFNDLEYKLKLDSLVKKHKIKNIKNKNIDLTFSDQIIQNIKRSKNSNELVAYAKNDDEKLAVINKEDDIYSLLFTNDIEDDKKVYSHIDLVTDHFIDNVNFVSIDEMKKNEVLENDRVESITDNIKNLVANYYPRNNLFSTSNLFKSILNSIVKEAKVVSDQNYEENNITQLLYLNYFKEELFNDKEVKELIAERFIKKAIQLDEVSTSSFKQTNIIQTFAYDPKSVIEEDFDQTDESSLNDYLDEILNTSDKLKTIRDNVFGIENLESVQSISNFSRVSNFKFGHWEGDPWYGCAVINFNIFPHHSMLYNFKSKENFRDDCNIEFSINKKNKINKLSNEKYFVDKSVDNFDITSSKSILIKVVPKLCASDRNFRDSEAYPHFILNDKFDSIFKENNSKSYVFYKIIDIIQDLLRMNIANYTERSITNEGDIDTLIEDYQDVKSDVIDLIELFSSVYSLYSARLQRVQALKIFEWQPKSINYSTRIPIGDTNPSFLLNGIISKHSNVYNTFKEAMRLSSDKRVTIITKSQAESCISDIKKLVDLVDNDTTSFISSTNYNNITSTQEDWKTHNTVKFYDIMKCLITSDVAQAFTFDVVNSYLDHQRFILDADRTSITTSEKFDIIDEIPKETVDYIEKNFYNMFFINKLSKSILFMSATNNLNKNISNSFNNNSIDFFKHLHIFDNSKAIKENKINSTGNKILSSNEDMFSKQVFFDTNLDYLNSNIYKFGIKTKSLNKHSYDAIIKITVSIVDKFNTNKYFIPKVFLFTPMFTNVSYLTDEMIRSITNNTNTNNIIGMYEISENISNRISLKNIDELLLHEENMFISAIKTKLNLSDIEEAVIMYKHMLHCHMSSNEISSIASNIFNIDNIQDLVQSNEVSNELFSIISNLSNKQFFDIFDNNKQKSLNNIQMSDAGVHIVPTGYNTIDKDNLSYSTIKEVKDLVSCSDLKENISSEYYDEYNIAINPKSFYYIDTTDANSDDNKYNLNDLEQLFNKILGIEDITANDSSVTIKNDRIELDDFNIVFKTEIL